MLIIVNILLLLLILVYFSIPVYHLALGQHQLYISVLYNILRSIHGVYVYLDDVLISDSSEQKHLDRFNHVLALMAERGFRVSKEKCAFQQCEVSYLGYMIDKDDLYPLKNKMEATVNAPAPTNTRNVSILLEVLIKPRNRD